MKKIGIITIHHNCNYGAVLQAYALQEKLNNLGYNAELLNYITPSGRNSMRLLSSSLKDNISTLLKIKNKILRINRFKSFINQRYRLSGKPIYDQNKLNENMFNYDVYITGSDQTFNLLLNKNIEYRKPYFLPFVKNTKKISYAASMGEKIQNISPTNKEWMKKALNEYDHILVRDEKTADFIEKELNISRPDIVLDPTLLLTSEEWNEISKPTKIPDEKYVLFYSVLSSPWVIKQVNAIAEKLNLKVIAPHHANRFEFSTNFKRMDFCGPEEFIDLVKNATVVLTTSFHGTIFSLLFNKPFLSFVLGEGNRITNLLKLTGLTNRAVYENSYIDIDSILTQNYKNVNEKLDALRKTSAKLLTDAIGE